MNIPDEFLPVLNGWLTHETKGHYEFDAFVARTEEMKAQRDKLTKDIEEREVYIHMENEEKRAAKALLDQVVEYQRKMAERAVSSADKPTEQ